jgi:hypothetical protein
MALGRNRREMCELKQSGLNDGIFHKIPGRQDRQRTL